MMQPITMSIGGIDDATTPFVTITSRCGSCGELLSQAKLDVRVVTTEDARLAATRDAAAAVAHACHHPKEKPNAR